MSSDESGEGGSPFLERREGGVAVLRFDDPERPVNVLGSAVMDRLESLLDRLAADGSVRRVVVASGKPGAFIAGADVDEIALVPGAEEGSEASRRGQAVFSKLAELPATTVAAVGGPCLGGGLELALACDARVAADDPKVSFSLPEVRLGIVPGFGGTQRLPRLVGFRAAVEMAVAGRSMRAREARDRGLVDAVVPAERLEEAAATLEPPRRRLPWPDRFLAWNGWLRRLVTRQVRSRTARMVPEPEMPAPFRALDLVEASYRLPLEQGLEREAEVLGECLASEASRNLVGLFRARTTLRAASSSWHGAEVRPVRQVAVVGAGVMGSGIAAAALDAGCGVVLTDLDESALRTAVKRIEEGLARRVARGRLTREEADARRGRLETAAGLDGLGDPDLVVEAIVERLETKRALFADLEERIRPDAILASNTSSLSIGAMGEGLRHPGRVVGLHFFNPVHRMPLVEIVPGGGTEPAAVAAAGDLCGRMGKVPVVVRDSPGFLVNRLLLPYLSESLRLLEEGVDMPSIERAARRFGMPMGPLALLDTIGLDVALHAGEEMGRAFGERAAPPGLLSALVDAGRLGAKTGGGLLDGRGRPADESVRRIEGYGKTRLDEADLRDRLVLVLVAEAVRALDEGLVARPLEVDVAMVMGTGFPPYRGGPLRYAHHRGLEEVFRRMERLALRHGARLRPPERLRALVRGDESFYDDRPPAGAA